MKKHRCTGWLLALPFFLLPLCGAAQTAEALLAEENFPAAAAAFTARDTRTDDFAAGEAWLSAGDASYYAGEDDEALSRYGKARLAFERVVAKTSAHDSLSALAQHKVGVAYYNCYEDSLAALAYREAVVLRDQVFSGPVRERAHSRMNLAQILLGSGGADSAAVLLREAIDIYAKASPTDSLNWMRGLTSLVSLSEDARDYQVGVDAARRATELLDNMPATDPFDAFATWYTIGSAYQVFGDLEPAQRTAMKTRSTAEALGDPLAVVQALNLLGGISSQKEQYDESLNYHLQALEMSRGTEIAGSELGLIYFNIALRYKELGRFEKALEFKQLAAPLLTSEPRYNVRLQSVSGAIYRQQKAFDKASVALDEGVRLLLLPKEGEVGNSDLSGLEPPELEILADLLGDRAEVFRQLGKTEEARADYTLLFDVQDVLRSRVTSDESRRYLSRNLRQFFDRAIDLEFASYVTDPQPAKAWYALALSERAKAYSLLTAVQKNRGKMITRERELRSRIAVLERAASAGSLAEKRLSSARLELDRLLRQNKEEAKTSMPVLNQKSLVSFLAGRQATAIAFHISDARAYRFTVTPDDQIAWVEIDEAPLLTARVNRWRGDLIASVYKGKSLLGAAEQGALDQAFLDNGLQLYEQLFAGFLPATKRVCILPDGPLSVLPFGALPTEKANIPLNYTSLEYLQNKATIHYAYSLMVWQELAGKAPAEYEQNLLAFAPDFQGASPATTMTRSASLRVGDRAVAGLAPLAFNRPEVEGITGLIPRSKAFYAADADRAAFLENVGKARILHLSTHGIVNVAAPELSFVAFSQLGDSLELEEMLYYNDLSALSVNTEMAVLSACETSLGAYVPGETTLSLASAFAAAGARSTLTTLWQVDDAATKDLIVRFYEGLAAGEDRATALAEAQLAHRESAQYAHPYYWSAMTLYGDAGLLPLEKEPSGWFVFLIIGAVSAAIGLLIWWSEGRKA